MPTHKLVSDEVFLAVWNAAPSSLVAAVLIGWTPSGVRCRAARLRRAGFAVKSMAANSRKTKEELDRMRASPRWRPPSREACHRGGIHSGQLATMRRLLRSSK